MPCWRSFLPACLAGVVPPTPLRTMMPTCTLLLARVTALQLRGSSEAGQP